MGLQSLHMFRGMDSAEVAQKMASSPHYSQELLPIVLAIAMWGREGQYDVDVIMLQ